MPHTPDQIRTNHRVGIALKVYGILLQSPQVGEVSAETIAAAAVTYTDALLAALEKGDKG